MCSALPGTCPSVFLHLTVLSWIRCRRPGLSFFHFCFKDNTQGSETGCSHSHHVRDVLSVVGNEHWRTAALRHYYYFVMSRQILKILNKIVYFFCFVEYSLILKKILVAPLFIPATVRNLNLRAETTKLWVVMHCDCPTYVTDTVCVQSLWLDVIGVCVSRIVYMRFDHWMSDWRHFFLFPLYWRTLMVHNFLNDH